MSDGGLPGPAPDTGPDPLVRRTILPRWLKSMVAAALVTASLAMLLSAILFSSNRTLADIAEREATAACKRERVILERLIDTKAKQIATKHGLVRSDERLRRLVVSRIRDKTTSRVYRPALRAELKGLDRDLRLQRQGIIEIRQGIAILRQELAATACRT